MEMSSTWDGLDGYGRSNASTAEEYGRTNASDYGFAANQMSSAQTRLQRLLDEAAAAHERVEQLVSQRPLESGHGQDLPPAQREWEYAFGTDAALRPHHDLIATLAHKDQATLAPPPPPRTSSPNDVEHSSSLVVSSSNPISSVSADMRFNFPAQMAELAEQVKRLTARNAGDSPVGLVPRSSSTAPPMQPSTTPTLQDDSYQLSTARVARERTAFSRLKRELSEARNSIRELDLENSSLRAALARARDELNASVSLRIELDDARRSQRELEKQVVAETRRADACRLELKEAEQERERLRTLLAGTVWYEARC
jgi:hypothetical protein